MTSARPLRALFATTAGRGHYDPLAVLAEGFAATGATVAFAAPAVMGEVIRSHGFEHLPTMPSPGRIDPIRAGGEKPRNSLVETAFASWVLAESLLPAALSVVESWRPDLVVHEQAELSSVLAAASRGIPAVKVETVFPAIARQLSDCVSPHLDRLARQAGISLSPTHTPSVSFTPASLDRHAAPGVVLARGKTLQKSTSARGALPRLYVSFGSVALGAGWAQTLAEVVGTASALGRVVVSTGGREAPGFGPKVESHAWVDEAVVLPDIDVVICHGGPATILRALSVGRPLVIVPLFADQPYNAEALAASGAGVAVPPGPDLAERLHAAVTAVLAERSYVAEAERLAAEMATHLSPVEVADTLRPLAG